MPLDPELLTLPEQNIAAEMAHGLGRAALIDTNVDDPYANLVESYALDPKNALAIARESLLAIGSNKMLTQAERDDQLEKGLDAFFDLTVKLDHAAFPATKPDEVKEGVPDYVPDGFVDMGKYRSTRFHERIEPGEVSPREQILVDKRAILEKYKPFLKDLMGRDFSGIDLQAKKRRLAIETAKEIYRSMQFSQAASEKLGGGLVNLSTVPEGVCRHQGLTFQVLCQTLGLKSRLLKSYRDGERHSTNLLRIDEQWYIFDVTNPDYQRTPAGNEWRPGAYKVDGPPTPNERKKYRVTGKFSGDTHTYLAHDNMYWRILDSEEF